MSSAATVTLRDTTIGKKMMMAVSGLVLFGFSIVHMLGNMQIFVGREAINSYHVLLYGLPTLLWSARIVLLAALVAHVVSAYQLTVINKRARPLGYARSHHAATSYAARTMVVSGVLLFLYLLHHIAHMTLGYTRGLGYAHDHVDVYANLVQSYRMPWMALISVVAALVFGSHVRHGAWSTFQSLGVSYRRYDTALRGAAVGIAAFVTLGYVSVPLAVMFGFVR
jgi:succinate dehydrogenase / fumarate reductase cytochrome b subunit